MVSVFLEAIYLNYLLMQTVDFTFFFKIEGKEKTNESEMIDLDS